MSIEQAISICVPDGIAVANVGAGESDRDRSATIDTDSVECRWRIFNQSCGRVCREVLCSRCFSEICVKRAIRENLMCR